MMRNSIFQRVETAYDLKRMQGSRIISIGCGGAASFLEDLARCGIGEFVLIDPDIVEESNIATQQTYLADIGSPKVDCIAARLMQINPDALFLVCKNALDDF